MSSLVCMSMKEACPDYGPEYGVMSLDGSQGQKLYFKREVRGQNYDVLTLSTDDDYCREPDETKDYVFGAHATKIFYKQSAGQLDLYMTSPSKTPTEFDSAIRITQHRLSPLEFAELDKNYRELGYVLIDVKLDKDLQCK